MKSGHWLERVQDDVNVYRSVEILFGAGFIRDLLTWIHSGFGIRIARIEKWKWKMLRVRLYQIIHILYCYNVIHSLH